MKVRFVDPRPLPTDAPAFVDQEAAKFYASEQRKAKANMSEFDQQPPAVRDVERVTGNVGIARRLVAQGVRSADEAEPIVREMLERRWGRA